jgi:MFS family permease
MSFWRSQWRTWFPALGHQVWILIIGRLLCQIGTGFTLFYAPVFFANQVGLSATAVGIGIGSGSVTGVFGRIFGGTLADSPRFGRRWTILLSAAVSALADVFLVLTYNFPTFLIGNLLMGLGIGLYWPATEALVADLTPMEQRNEAFALTRLGDSLGLGLGVILGGILISATGMYRALFVIDGISFVVFLAIVYWAIADVRTASPQHSALKGWAKALGDRILMIFFLVGSIFTTYLAFVNSALPLYFSRFVPQGTAPGFSSEILTVLFSLHVALTVLLQMPVIRLVNHLSRLQVLMVSALFWGGGFVLMWVTGTVSAASLLWAILALTLMAIATVAYTPAATAFVVQIAPEPQRGVYLSVSSLCWAVGYFVGPILGGWAMDQPAWFAHRFWLMSATSVLVCIAVLIYLDRSSPKAH